MDKRSSLTNEYQSIVDKYPDAAAMKCYLKFCYIENLAGITPAPVGQGEEWAAIISSAEENREYSCKSLRGKTRFSAGYGTYTVTLNELKAVMNSHTRQGNPKYRMTASKKYETERGIPPRR